MDEVVTKITLMLLYVWLPDFCHRCGIINHTMGECTNEEEEDRARRGFKRYREWLLSVTLGMLFKKKLVNGLGPQAKWLW